eukprot:TRINITY_DN422_c0_g1_i8.p1 TRINITY_DN422_c0_g1~~TRINITY_DN422_c0_g1_i8.p1  ORF type:complete len:122 (+),score=38.86 TRINITY_DN422_c0_g1_i8:81-446(+)
MFFFLMIRRPPRSTQSRSSAASDVYKRQQLLLGRVVLGLLLSHDFSVILSVLDKFALLILLVVGRLSSLLGSFTISNLLITAGHFSRLDFTGFLVKNSRNFFFFFQFPHVLCVDTLSLIHI